MRHRMAIRHAISSEIRRTFTSSSDSSGRRNIQLWTYKQLIRASGHKNRARPVRVMPRAAYRALAFAPAIACSEDLPQDIERRELAMPGHGPAPSLLSDHRSRATGSHKRPGTARHQDDHRGKLKPLSLCSPELSFAHRRALYIDNTILLVNERPLSSSANELIRLSQQGGLQLLGYGWRIPGSNCCTRLGIANVEKNVC